jgi:hypothetical protein
MVSHLRNPHHRALTTLSGIASFLLLGTLALWGFYEAGTVDLALLWISLIFLLFFTLLWIIIWALGRYQMYQAKAFLASNRPLVRWVYSAQEWQDLKERIWQDEKQDWKLQWGCLTVLLGLAGSITGGLLGIEDGLFQIMLRTLLGFFWGALGGGLIGALVAGGNYWGARTEYLNPEPGEVALGRQEIFANGNYFKGNGKNKYIQQGKILDGNPMILEFLLVFPPRPRREPEEIWTIPIPDSYIKKVDSTLSALLGD